MQRKYDYRLIRRHRPYTIASLAKLYQVSPGTVRAWINKHGLECALTSTERPQILDGKKTKAWMKQWQHSKKQKCRPDEMYCVRCKSPRPIVPDSFVILPSNTNKITAQGDCVECGLTLNSFNTRANIDELRRRFTPKKDTD